MAVNQFEITADTGGGDSYPTWSPDSMRIAFVGSAADSGARISVVNRNGSGLTHLFSPNLSSVPDFVGRGLIDWSPDGGTIAFTASHLFLLDVISHSVTKIGELEDCRDPAFSPSVLR